MQRIRKYFLRIGETVVIGSLLGVGFVVPALWWLVFPGLVWWLCLITQAKSYSQASVNGLYTFFILNVWSYSWFLSVPPVDWLPVADELVWVFVVVYWLTSALWSALPGLLLAPILYYSYQKFFIWFLVPIVSIGWVMADILGSLLFSIFFYGPGGTINTNMSVGYIGYQLAQHPSLFHFSAWGGVYALTLVLVGLASVIWCGYVVRGKRKAFIILVGAVIAILCLTALPTVSVFFQPSIKAGGYTVLVLETDFVGQLHDEYVQPEQRLHYYSDILQTLDLDDFDFIVLPEDARLMESFGQNLLGLAKFRSVFGTSTNAMLIDSGLSSVDGKMVLRGSITQVSDLQQIHADKQYLVPQGEFLPSLYATALRFLGFGAVIDEMEASLAFRPGPMNNQVDAENSVPRILFCFESVNPRGVRQLIDTSISDRPLIVHPLSHAWFNEPTILQQQLDIMLRIQARWNDVFIISAGNKAPSALYSPDGALLVSDAVTPLQHNTFIRAYKFSF